MCLIFSIYSLQYINQADAKGNMPQLQHVLVFGASHIRNQIGNTVHYRNRLLHRRPPTVGVHPITVGVGLARGLPSA